MKIVTVNVSEEMLDDINKLLGEDGLYPSRSELIRCAVHDFLVRELKGLDLLDLDEYNDDDDPDQDSDPGPGDLETVRVPITRDKTPIKEFKTYKIVRRLEDIAGYERERNSDLVPVEHNGRSKNKELGNPFWERIYDDAGNVISFKPKF